MLRNGLKVLHILGLVVFLGSIITFIIASELSNESDLAGLVFARELISTGTLIITIPSMWLVIVTGTGMAIISARLKQTWVRIKFVVSIIIAINAHAFVMSAVKEATLLAKTSLQKGIIHVDYLQAYTEESMFGAINVLLILSLIIIAVFKPGKIEI
ncbi:MAG: DUF2269 family protein [Gammaproteobacteria bacterium]|nr:DUF2269 family protein [Gammaproteobacteria bacterium]